MLPSPLWLPTPIHSGSHYHRQNARTGTGQSFSVTIRPSHNAGTGWPTLAQPHFPAEPPLVLFTSVPSSSCTGATSHLSMYSNIHLQLMCFRTAFISSSCDKLSKNPLISTSTTQAYFQHRLRVCSSACIADLLNRYP